MLFTLFETQCMLLTHLFIEYTLFLILYFIALNVLKHCFDFILRVMVIEKVLENVSATQVTRVTYVMSV